MKLNYLSGKKVRFWSKIKQFKIDTNNKIGMNVRNQVKKDVKFLNLKIPGFNFNKLENLIDQFIKIKTE